MRTFMQLLHKVLVLCAAFALQSSASGQTATAPIPAQARSISPAGTALDPARRWVSVRNGARDLAVATSGDVYAIDPDGNLWRLPQEAVQASRFTQWMIQPGKYSRIIATLDGSVWALDGEGGLYRRTGASWARVASGVVDVGASPDGGVAVLLADGRVSAPALGPAAVMAPGNEVPTQLIVDPHGLPWLAYGSGTVLRWNGSGWAAVAQPGDGLRRIAAGADGEVLAVTASGLLARRRPESGAWEPYRFDGAPPRMAASVVIGPDGMAWVIDRTGEISKEVPVNPAAAQAAQSPAVFTRLLRWTPVGGTSTSVGVGADGSAFSLALDGTVWQWKTNRQWSGLPGKFRAVAAGSKGQTWALDAMGRVHAYAAGQWQELPGAFRLIASDGNTAVWAVGADDILYRWQPAARQWNRVLQLAPAARAIAIAPGDVPWMIAANGEVQNFSQGGWRAVPGISAISLAVGPEGTVYAAADDQSVHWLDKREMAWKPATGKVLAIAVGPGGAPWAVAPDNTVLASGRFLSDEAQRAPSAAPPPIVATAPVLTFVPGPNPTLQAALSFKPLATPGLNFQSIGIGGNGAVLALGSNGNLFCFSNQSQRFIFASPSQASRIAVDGAGMPWLANASGAITHFDKGAWQLVPEFLGKDVDVGPDGAVWALDLQGDSYRYAASSNRFERVPVLASDAPVKARRIAGANSGVYWIATEANQLASCEKGTCKTQLVGVRDVAVAPDNTVFALDLLGSVRRFNSRTRQFEQQIAAGIDIAVGPQGLPWLVTSSGGISYAGLFNPASRSVNTDACALPFASSPAPVQQPNAQLRVMNISATLPAGGTTSLLVGATLNGRPVAAADVTVVPTFIHPLLSIRDATLFVSGTAAAGATLTAAYNVCPARQVAACVSANATITVAGQQAPPTAPGAPTGVVATPGNGQASVSFTPPASNGGSPITGYIVTSSPGNISASGAGSPIVVGGLTNGTAYTFTVRAQNAVGTSAASAPSPAVTPTAGLTAPGAPTGATATPGNGQASVSFTPPASNGGSPITGYIVTSSPGNITASGGASPIVVGGLTNGTAYTFTVRAQNAVGMGAASAPSAPVTPAGVPGQPTGVAGNVVSPSGDVTLSWNAPASNGGSAIQRYVVGSTPAGFGTTTATPATTTPLANYIAVDAQQCLSYQLTVAAQNAVGTGSASTPFRLGRPAAPTSVAASNGPPGSISVSFTPPTDRGGMSITQYFVIGNGNGPQLTGSGAASPVVVDASAAQSGATYTFTVTAITGICDSAPSAPSAPYTIP